MLHSELHPKQSMKSMRKPAENKLNEHDTKPVRSRVLPE